MESPQRDPTTPGVRLPACACPPAWADEVHRAGQIGRKTGRQGDREDSPTHRAEQAARGHLLTLPAMPAYPAHQPCLPTLPRFSPYPRVSYCQRKRHTRTPQNGLLSSHFTIFQSIKTLRTDTQQLARQLNIISII